MLRAVVFLLAAASLVGAHVPGLVGIDECPEEKCNHTRCSLEYTEKAIDLVFLIDGSGSVSYTDFNASLEWALTTLDQFNPGRRIEKLKVLLVQYSTNVRLELNEILNGSSNEIRARVENIAQMRQSTQTYTALDFVNKQIVHLTRYGAFKILVTMTDGQPGDQRDPQAIDTARNNFNVMVSVGIGGGINDEIRYFAYGVEPIHVTDFVSLQNESIFDDIANSTFTDCIDVRAWCGPSTEDTLNVSYCICTPSSSINSSLIENYQLEIISANGILKNSSKLVGETSDLFDGLDPFREYTITVNALANTVDVETVQAMVNCSTAATPELSTADECPDDMCNDTRCSLEYTDRAIDLVFLIDGSGSVSSTDFNASLEWALATLDQFNPSGRIEKINIFLVQYSSNVQLELTGIINSSSSEIRARVENIGQMSQLTMTYAALDYVNNQVIPLTRNGAFKILVTMTDGRPSDSRNQQAIDDARNKFNVMVSVGIGGGINDEIRYFAYGVEPIHITDFVSLRNESIFDDIANSTFQDCVDIRAWCGPSTESSLNVSYCICAPSSDINSSLIENYQLQVISANGIVKRSILKSVGETSAMFDGLDAFTEYAIKVNALTSRTDVDVVQASINCSTTEPELSIADLCPQEICNHTRCSLEYTEKAIDMVFLIDGSGSVSNSDFEASLEWALTTLDQFNPSGRIEKLNVFMVQYSSSVRLELNEMLNSSSNEIRTRVENIIQMRQSTQTYTALDYVNTHIVPLTRSGAFKILVTMTDGQPSDQRDPQAIDTARNNFNVMVSVGIGGGINDEIRYFAYGVEPIHVTDFVSLRDESIFDIIENSTFEDCIDIRAWCGPSTETTLNVSYCICTTSSNMNSSLIENYQLEIFTTNGIVKDSLITAVGETSVLFEGLDAFTEYTININALTTVVDVEIVKDSINCSTAEPRLPAADECPEVICNHTRCSLEYTEKAIDLVFLIDGSGSVSYTDFKASLEWALTTLDQFNPSGRAERLNVFMVQYSSYVRLELNEMLNSSSIEIRARVENIAQMSQSTQTYAALNYVNSQIVPLTRNGAFKILVTMTDGQPSDQRDQHAIDTARNNFDIMVSVGIGGGINDEIRYFAYGVEPIHVTDFVSLQNESIFDIIANSTFTDCIDIRAWCGPNTETTLNVSYCVCTTSSGFNSSLMENYQLEITSANGVVKNSLLTAVGETSALFGGLDAFTEYTINVNALTRLANVEIVKDSINCSTAEPKLPAVDECPKEICNHTRCSLEYTEKAIDLVFLIDGSGSVSYTDFKASLEWALTTLDQFNPSGRAEKLNVFMVQYSSYVRLELNEMLNSSSIEIRSRVENIAQMSQSTRTYAALNYVNSQIVPLTRNGAFKILVTMTDGQPSDQRDHHAIDTARNNFDIMVSVGIGGGINDEIRYFAYGVEPIHVTDFVSLQNENIFDIIANSTFTDCIDIRAWCGPNTETTLNVSYCICTTSSDFNSSLMENYQLEITSANGVVKNSLLTAVGETSALFVGLDAFTEYTINVNALTRLANVEIVKDSINCSTAETKLPAVDECPKETCNHTRCSLAYTEKAIDLVFLIDGSGSVSYTDFNASLEWALTTLDQFNPSGRIEKLNVFMVQYSSYARLELAEKLDVSSNEIRARVENITQMSRGTMTYAALDYVNDQIVPLTRNETFKILVTMTDGRPNDQRDPQAIDDARNNFDIMVSVGIGGGINDEIRYFAYGVEPIHVTDFVSLRGERIFDIIANSTFTDCIDIRAWCGPSTESTLNISYCICSPLSNIYMSMIEFYQLEVITTNGVMKKILFNDIGETSAFFDGLDSHTEYIVNVNVQTNTADLQVVPAAVNCSTSDAMLLAADTCPEEECNNTRCSLEYTEKAIDLVFLIDGSGSVSYTDFNASLEWALKTLDQFNPSRRVEKLNVFMVQYSSYARLEFAEKLDSSSDEIRAHVENITQMSRGTMTYAALDYVNDQILPLTRNETFKILVTMTDGQPSDQRDPQAIDDARNNFDIMVSVGIGGGINDEIRYFAYGVEPIHVTDFVSLRGENIFDIIANSTFTDCIDIRAWCGPSTESTLNVSYCICTPSSNVNSSIIENYQLEIISENGTVKKSLLKEVGETSALIGGLDAFTGYTVNINILSNNADVHVVQASFNCSTTAAADYAFCNKQCPIINTNASKLDMRKAMFCELSKWRCASHAWKKEMTDWWVDNCDRGFNVLDSLWTNLTRSCENLPRSDCVCAGARRCDVDPFGCVLCECLDGKYKNPKELATVWQRSLHMYQEYLAVYKKAYAMCDSSCSVVGEE